MSCLLSAIMFPSLLKSGIGHYCSFNFHSYPVHFFPHITTALGSANENFMSFIANFLN